MWLYRCRGVLVEVAMTTDRELIPMLEAARRLGVSKLTMRRIVREAGLTTYDNPLDKRQRLLDAAEVERVARPRPRMEEDAKKLAA